MLESLWRKEKGISRDFYHGLIQIAAAFVHLQKGTPPGACRLFQKASSYLASYQPSWLGLDLQGFLVKVEGAVFRQGAYPRIYLK